MNNIIFIALVLALGSVALNVILLIKFATLVTEIHSVGIHYGDLLKTAEDQIRISENGNAIVKGIHESYQTMAKLQSRINEQYDRMFEQYERILDQYKHLAEAFKLSEERYADMYEQYDRAIDKLDKIEKDLTDITKPSPFWCGVDWTDDADDSEYEFAPVNDDISCEEAEMRREAITNYVESMRPEEVS